MTGQYLKIIRFISSGNIQDYLIKSIQSFILKLYSMGLFLSISTKLSGSLHLFHPLPPGTYQFQFCLHIDTIVSCSAIFNILIVQFNIICVAFTAKWHSNCSIQVLKSINFAILVINAVVFDFINRDSRWNFRSREKFDLL